MLLDVNPPSGADRLDLLNKKAEPLDSQAGSDEPILRPDEGMTTGRLEQFLDEIYRQPPWRRQADKEADYFDGNQLTAEQIAELEDRGFAPIISNLIQPTINLVLGMEAKTRTDWVVRPEVGEMSSDLAEALSMELHKAEVATRADRACSDAYADQAKVGLGWVEVSKSSDPLQGKYRVKRVHRRELFWDWRAVEPDLSDARYLVRKRWLDEDTAIAAFPEHRALIQNVLQGWANWDLVTTMNSGYTLELNRALDVQRGFSVEQYEWLNSVRRRVACYEVWYRTIVNGFVLRLPNGRTVEFDIDNEDHVTAVYAGAITPQPAIFKKMRLAWWLGPHRVGDEASPYKHGLFPYVPFWGFREDRTNTPYGLIRSMLSPQDEINARRSKMLWLLNSKRVIADGDVVLDHDATADEVGRPDAYIKLNPNRQRDSRFEVQDGGALATQQFQVLEAAKQEINQVSGIYQSMLGQSSQATSGLAINSLIEQGSTTLAEINDNYSFARRLVGEMLLELVRGDLEGQINYVVTLGEEGEERTVVLNQPGMDELGRPALLNDVSKARVSVVLDDVQTSPTFRMQQLQALTELVKSAPPQLQGLLYDMVVEAMDMPKKREALKRIRSAMGIAEDGQPPDPEKAQLQQQLQALTAQMQALMQEANDRVQKAEVSATKAQLSAANKEGELALRARELAIKEADVALKAQGQLVDHAFRVEDAAAARDIAASAGEEAPEATGQPAAQPIDMTAMQQLIQQALAPLQQQLTAILAMEQQEHASGAAPSSPAME